MSKTLNVSPQFYGAVKKAREAGEYLNEQVEKLDDRVRGAADAQNRIDELETVYAEKQRIADLDLELQIRGNKLTAFSRIANETGHAVITDVELQALNTTIDGANDRLIEAVTKCEGKGKAALHSAVASTKSAAALELAETKAQLSNAHTQIAFLTDQVSQMRVDNAAQRETATAMVEAATRSQVNVTNSGK